MGYLDGSSWVDVTRIRSRADGMTDVICRRGSRSFQAAIGRDAIVRLAPNAQATRVFATLGVNGVALGRASALYRVRGSSNEDGLTLATRLARAAEVLEALPDLVLARRKAAVSIPPNDEHYSAQWYLDRIAIERAWRITTGSRDTSIVVIDNGCDMTHPDLVEAFVGGRDVRDDDDDPSPMPNTDGNSHGTACAGIIAGVADNGIGIAGVCPQCSLHCVRLLDDSDPPLVPLSADIAAFNYALDVGAAVVSNSWGFKEAIEVPDILGLTIKNVAKNGRGGLGAVVVFASGNDNRELNADEITALPGVITVGAINNFDEVAPFSNSGASLDLTAPTGTYTTDISGADGDDPGDYMRLFGGTSAACPVVAGVAGLILSANPELTSDEVAALLVETARPAPFATPDDTGHDITYGYGIVDPERAVLRATGRDIEPDAGVDASAPDDASTPDSAPTSSSSGCAIGSRGSAGGAPWLTGLLGSLALLRRRRHSSSTSTRAKRGLTTVL